MKLKHLFSHSPRGIWNQLLIALITVSLSEIMRILKNTKKTAWEFYQLICQYLLDPWEAIQEELDRKKKPSRGRQRVRDRPHKKLNYGEDYAIVNPISKEHYLK